MESIGIRELRQHASRYVAAAREGRAFVVTDRGTPVARLIPLEDPADRFSRLVAQGELTPASAPRQPIDVESLPPGDLTRHLDEMREDR